MFGVEEKDSFKIPNYHLSNVNWVFLRARIRFLEIGEMCAGEEQTVMWAIHSKDDGTIIYPKFLR
jgi:hypothetical protein